ncbi:capsule biosynthesis protein CapA [Cereibacter changlensis JA139]|uniref:Capsule biosynthesis protein CapA n=2 Tax=Cereibacter changlensis TaxID=402884 RepID=A0A2T4JR53_9RHOB|nr:capsule biosynthesis protein CapA [Cereibacter changlensis]PTE20378.1 capsule biosynthesis protein CapA [Cereibacter changlensis JA139]PZX55323.1 capsular polysaccharide export protein [Cereibacter changlensis]
MRVTGEGRRFLFLQGPHGPFFQQLGRMLTLAGAEVWRAGFNGGDRAFWPDSASYLPFTEVPSLWPQTCRAILAERGITDIALYGDTRPLHAEAVRAARAAGLTVHVFEEGYLRPSWITYERGGANGNSRLMQLSLAQMRNALAARDMEQPDAPARWGDMRQHMFWGALYHFRVLTGRRHYPAYQPHRGVTVGQELALHLRRLALTPLHAAQRRLAEARIARGGFPYHLVLLQLEHDSSFRAHGPFAGMADFLSTVTQGFAEGAAPHHHLVFKAHPLEDDRTPLGPEIRRLARLHGLTDRVHLLRGGKLAPLLDHARSAVTVNSTAGQQALWRGLPLKAFGAAVYGKPEFVSPQPLAGFFARPERPDSRAYRAYRQFLLETSQVPGGFYSRHGRRALMRQMADMMLRPEDPYDALSAGIAAPRQQLRLVT